MHDTSQQLLQLIHTHQTNILGQTAESLGHWANACTDTLLPLLPKLPKRRPANAEAFPELPGQTLPANAIAVTIAAPAGGPATAPAAASAAAAAAQHLAAA